MPLSGAIDVGCPAIQIEHLLQLAERSTDFTVLPHAHRSLVEVLFLLAHAEILLLAAADFRNQLQRLSFTGLELQNILQRLARMREVAVVDMLPRQPEPVVNLVLGAPAFR